MAASDERENRTVFTTGIVAVSATTNQHLSAIANSSVSTKTLIYISMYTQKIKIKKSTALTPRKTHPIFRRLYVCARVCVCSVVTMSCCCRQPQYHSLCVIAPLPFGLFKSNVKKKKENGKKKRKQREKSKSFLHFHYRPSRFFLSHRPNQFISIVSCLCSFFSLSSACSFASLALYYAINNTRQYYA